MLPSLSLPKLSFKNVWRWLRHGAGRVLLIRAGLGSLAVVAAFQAHSQPPRTAVPHVSAQIKEDLYLIQANGRGNVGLLVTPEGLILIDDEYAVDYPNLVAQIKTISRQPIKYIFNTHHHADHADGNGNFLAATEVVLHRKARANLVAGKVANLPRLAFADEASITLGGHEVLARHFGRGHTNGDSIIYFPAQRAIHTGDLFVNGPYFIPTYRDHGSLKEWPSTLNALLATWDFDVVIPGHGPVATRADLIRFRNRLEEMRSRVSEMKRSGKSKADMAAMLKADFSEFGGTIAAEAQIDGILSEMP